MIDKIHVSKDKIYSIVDLLEMAIEEKNFNLVEEALIAIETFEEDYEISYDEF